MRGYLSLGLIAAYFVIAYLLEGKAWRHFKPGVARRWYQRPLWEPQLFTDEGQRHRDRAISFYLLGGAALIALLVLIRFL